jgi:pantetheine-phosphate adenylyltransferase
MTSPEHAYLSSSAVREIAMFGGDITGFVPPSIVDEVTRKLGK